MNDREMQFGAAVLIALAAPAGAQRSAQSCDRACLAGLLDTYLDAVAKHDARAAPLAGNYRATENAVPISPGTGMWSSFGGPGAVQRRYYDPVTGQALFFGPIKTGGQDAVASICIKILKNKIADAEWIYSRQGETMVSIAGFTAEPPRSDSPVARDKRSTREQLIAAADSYFEGLARHESAGVLRVKGCPRGERDARDWHAQKACRNQRAYSRVRCWRLW